MFKINYYNYLEGHELVLGRKDVKMLQQNQLLNLNTFLVL